MKRLSRLYTVNCFHFLIRLCQFKSRTVRIRLKTRTGYKIRTRYKTRITDYFFFLKNWADYFLVRYKHKIKRSRNSTTCSMRVLKTVRFCMSASLLAFFFSRVPSFAHIPKTLRWSWGQLRSITWLQILSYRAEEGRLFVVNLREDITLL